MASPLSHIETTSSLLPRVESHQLYRRPPRNCANQKCDNCRQKKLKCVPEGSGCKQCSKAKWLCPGLTTRKYSRRTPVDPPATPWFASAPRRSETLDDGHQDEFVSLNPACTVQNPSSHQPPKAFHLDETDSYGTSRRRDILADRSSFPGGLLSQKAPRNSRNGRSVPKTIFTVSITSLKLRMSIHSNKLYWGLEKVLGVRLGGINKAFNGKVLLTHYTKLKEHFDSLCWLPAVLRADPNIIEEWELLLEGFLANRSAFRCFDFRHPNNSGLLSYELGKALTQQELEDGINTLNQAYMKADSHITSLIGQTGRGKLMLMPLIRSFMSKDEDEIKMRKEEQLWRLHSSFNEQYKCLKRIAQEHCTILDPLSWQLQNSRQAWSAAITAMRRLSKLESSPKLPDALCFLCASRAVAETTQHNRDGYLSAFSQDLNKWSEIVPGVEEVSRLMWEIDLNSVPQLEPQFSTEIEQLRSSVAALLIKTNKMFGRGHHSSHEETGEPGVFSLRWLINTEQAPQAMESPGPLATARQKEPPDRFPYKEKTPPSLTDVVTLVTSLIFVLVVYFMLVFVYVSPIAIMGFSNPWQNSMSQADTRIPTPSYPATSPTESHNTFSNTLSIPPLRGHSREPTMCLYDNNQTPDNEYCYHNRGPLASSSTGDTVRTLDYNPGSSLDPRVLDNGFHGPLLPWSWDVMAAQGDEDEDKCHSSNHW